MSETDEIKVWQTLSAKQNVARVLIADGVSFSYDLLSGIMFSAPASYVEELQRRLADKYEVMKAPVINEFE